MALIGKDEDDDFFGCQDDDGQRQQGDDEFGSLMQHERLAKESELKTVAFMDAFDEFKESKLQEGFEDGMTETFDVARRIGKMLGKATTIQKLMSQNCKEGDCVTGDDDSRISISDKDTIDQATKITSKFFTESFQQDKASNCKDDLSTIENRIKTLLQSKSIQGSPTNEERPTLLTLASDLDDDNGNEKLNMDFYSKFDQTHGKESRKHWYNDATQAYVEARPRYPETMIREALEEANLLDCPSGHILEIGSGPGTATLPLAKLGYRITAIDPAPQNCIAARQQCVEYVDKTVTVIESTFEDFPLEDINSPVSAILCPTSFHWITPDVACRKTAELLRPTGGCLMLWWALPPQPSNEVCDTIQSIYDECGLSDLGFDIRKYCSKEFSFPQLDAMRTRLNESGFFKLNDDSLQLNNAISYYTPKKYITLLSTLSPYIALKADKRATLFERLLERLEKLCQDQGTSELELQGCFGKQCFWVKPQ